MALTLPVALDICGHCCLWNASHGTPTGSVMEPPWYMQDAGLVLLHMLRAHAAAYRAIKKMPGTGLQRACTSQALCAVSLM